MFVEDQVQQWINKYGWKLQEDGNVFIVNQEENIKTKNITETITFESECVTKPFISHRKLVIYNLISIILMWHFYIIMRWWKKSRLSVILVECLLWTDLNSNLKKKSIELMKYICSPLQIDILL